MVEEEEELASLPCVQLALLSLRFNLQLWVTHIPGRNGSGSDSSATSALAPSRPACPAASSPSRRRRPFCQPGNGSAPTDRKSVV